MAGARSTVLVVDDDAVLLGLLRVNFQVEGFSVFTADSGPAALALAQREHPDAVVADVGVPDAEGAGGIDGLGVVRSLRDDPSTAAIPVVLLSRDRPTGDAADVDDFVTKPFEPIDLVRRVRRLLAPGRHPRPQG